MSWRRSSVSIVSLYILQLSLVFYIVDSEEINIYWVFKPQL